MIRCGKTGAVLLYGTGCVRCDCGGAIDPARDDHTVAAFRATRWRPDAIDDLLMGQGMYPSGSVYEAERRRYWHGVPGMHPAEVITDPADRRGLDARPARVPA